MKFDMSRNDLKLKPVLDLGTLRLLARDGGGSAWNGDGKKWAWFFDIG